MYCKNCGRIVADDTAFCCFCGTRLNATQPQQNTTDSDSNLVFAIAGFLIPIVGLILYLVYESSNPARAKAAGKGALISVIVSTVLSVLISIISLVAGFSLMAFDFYAYLPTLYWLA